MSIILGIETSCDETAAAIVKNGTDILSNEIYSQIDIHEIYGGVVPEIASRNHIEKIDIMVQKALQTAGLTLGDIDGIAVTNRPGLVGALLVGLSFAKALAYGIDVPLLAINHIEAHMAANYLEHTVPFPHIGLVISGGHSHIFKVTDYLAYEVLGQTRDDAVGEVFDKIARALELGYPGGPWIEKEAKKGEVTIDFPKAVLENPLDFSFSGVKSSVLNYINQQKMKALPLNIPNIAASFQETAIDTLVEKTLLACEIENIWHIALAGGVASNQRLRSKLIEKATEKGVKVFVPSPLLCTDNGAMVAAQGHHVYLSKDFAPLSTNAIPSGKL